uniref:NADH-ubiquinone oxidoreductase chain 2 n=1 Tax=Monotoma quadricollis TaxID=346807 RepID=A0A343A3N4_9CUCU|nr:NADH dehydrogenase subunit 2 [Monotoma quadricollis]AOY39162.1 NADH dehydrogenase subunit 2 [Monotoma quadricollis]
MFKFYKLLFFNSMILGTLISISSYSWFSMWMGLEINLLSIIPIFNNKNSFSSESSIKYFITQAMASMTLLLSIIMLMNLNKFFPSNLFNTFIILMNSAFFLKMGAAPFHFWFPEIMDGLNWMNNLILMTWQKIAPMILLFYNFNMNFLIFIILMSTIIGSIIGLNQTSIRKIMAYSSINHISWLLSSMFFSMEIWLMYFLIYCFITMNLVILFNKFNIFFIKQIISNLNSNKTLKMFFLLNFLSLGGLPPFLGFYPKWLVINNFINKNTFIIPIILIIFTLVTLYFYIRIIFSSLLFNSSEFLKFNFTSKNNFFFSLMNFISIFALMIMILSMSY